MEVDLIVSGSDKSELSRAQKSTWVVPQKSEAPIVASSNNDRVMLTKMVFRSTDDVVENTIN